MYSVAKLKVLNRKPLLKCSLTEIGITGPGGIGRPVYPAVAEQTRRGRAAAVAAGNNLVPANNPARLLKSGSTQSRSGGGVRSGKFGGSLEAGGARGVDGSRFSDHAGRATVEKLQSLGLAADR